MLWNSVPAETESPACTTGLFENIFKTKAEELEEENKDLKRQVLFLKQQLNDKDRKIKQLEEQVSSGLKESSSVSSFPCQNSTTQVN